MAVGKGPLFFYDFWFFFTVVLVLLVALPYTCIKCFRTGAAARQQRVPHPCLYCCTFCSFCWRWTSNCSWRNVSVMRKFSTFLIFSFSLSKTQPGRKSKCLHFPVKFAVSMGRDILVDPLCLSFVRFQKKLKHTVKIKHQMSIFIDTYLMKWTSFP